jgi:hypothetical protein
LYAGIAPDLARISATCLEPRKSTNCQAWSACPVFAETTSARPWMIVACFSPSGSGATSTRSLVQVLVPKSEESHEPPQHIASLPASKSWSGAVSVMAFRPGDSFFWIRSVQKRSPSIGSAQP